MQLKETEMHLEEIKMYLKEIRWALNKKMQLKESTKE